MDSPDSAATGPRTLRLERKRSRRRLHAEIQESNAERLRLQQEVEQLRAIIWGCHDCSQHVCEASGHATVQQSGLVGKPAIGDLVWPGAPEEEHIYEEEEEEEDNGEPASEPLSEAALTPLAMSELLSASGVQGRLRAALNQALASQSLHLAVYHHQLENPGFTSRERGSAAASSSSSSGGVHSVQPPQMPIEDAADSSETDAMKLCLEPVCTALHPSTLAAAAELPAPFSPDHARVALERVADLTAIPPLISPRRLRGKKELPRVLNRVPPCMQAPPDPCLLSAELVLITHSTFQAYHERSADVLSLERHMAVSEEMLKGMVSEMRARFSELHLCDPRELQHEQRLVFWLNVMNASILGSLCVSDIPPGQQGHQFPVKEWVNFLQHNHILVGGHELSLFEVEHLILRACSQPPTGKLAWLFCQAMHEARQALSSQCELRFGYGLFAMALESAVPEVSFGISYPIRSGCPPLRVYRPKAVMPQLLLNCAHYIRGSLQVDESQRRVWLPALFKYYFNDFGASTAEVLDFVRSTLLDVPSALESVDHLTGIRASHADLELVAESRYLASKFDAFQPQAFEASIEGQAAAACSRVSLQNTDFDWTFHFSQSAVVCPELEGLECNLEAHAITEVVAAAGIVRQKTLEASAEEAQKMPVATWHPIASCADCQQQPLPRAPADKRSDGVTVSGGRVHDWAPWLKTINMKPTSLSEVGCCAEDSELPGGQVPNSQGFSLWSIFFGCRPCGYGPTTSEQEVQASFKAESSILSEYAWSAEHQESFNVSI